ncbi:MAG: hypothetical protein LBQ96_03780 [Fusobacteriaceae bacterium]|nr:hypothetical protein [Fusobacteriaceae bacterium]
MAKLKSVICAYQIEKNNEFQGTFNIIGVFDNLIQPLFPYPMLNLSLVLTFEDMEKDMDFELRLNSPDDDLINSGVVRVHRDPFGTGKTVLNLEKFLVSKRGKYTMDILEKTEEKLLFIKTADLFIADYPPQRRISSEEKARILADDSLIQHVKVTFQPFGAQREINVQINLDKNAPVEPGYLTIPENDRLIVDGVEYDMTGVRRQFEWIFGGPKKKPEEAAAEQTPEEVKTPLA